MGKIVAFHADWNHTLETNDDAVERQLVRVISFSRRAGVGVRARWGSLGSWHREFIQEVEQGG